jgi:hypothetical protein
MDGNQKPIPLLCVINFETGSTIFGTPFIFYYMRIILILMFLSADIFAQITFNHRQNLGFQAFGYSSVEPVGSGYFLTALGATSLQYQGRTQAIFASADSSGQILWHRSIIGEGGIRHIGAFQANLTKKNDYSFITAGTEFGYGDKACLFNYNSNGDTIWLRKFYSPNDTGNFIRGDGLCFADDGGYYIGSSIQPSTDLDSKILLTKTDSLGNEEWYRTYGSSSLYYREEWPVLRNIGGQIIMIARKWKWIWATTSNYEMMHQIWWIDSLGNIENIYTTTTIKPGTSNTRWLLGVPKDIIKTKDGGWLVSTGIGTELQTAPPHPVLFDSYIYKLDSNLNFVWDRQILGETPTYELSFIKTIEKEDSSLMAFGMVVEQSIAKGIAVKLSPQGDSLWGRTFYTIGAAGDEHILYDCKPTSDGGYVLCGQVIAISGATPQQGWLLKLDSMGCLVPGCHITEVENIAGQEEKIDIKVYPNPVRLGEYLNFYIPKIQVSSPLQVHLYNIEGQLLQNHSLPSDDATYMLPTEGMTAGTYILQVLDEGGRILGVKQFAIR